GSRLPEITTRATPGPDGWRLTGEKCWVSRLSEASAFVVFAKDPEGTIQAAVVDADANGVTRRPETPSGLGGRACATVAFQAARLPPHAILSRTDSGDAIFRTHFAAFRPLVAATALGTAAGVHTGVLRILQARTATGLLPRLRDTTLATLARTAGDLNG